jgi:transcription antitermination factor NusG
VSSACNAVVASAESGVPAARALAGEEQPAAAYWYAVHTKAKHERKVAHQLEQNSIPVFLPTLREVHDWSDRQKVLEVPLFACYVFVNVPSWQQVHTRISHTPGIFSWVTMNGEPAPIPPSQIEAVRSALNRGTAASRYPFLKAGQKVRVRGGSLDGVEGILVANNGDSRLVVSIDLIQQSVAVALHGYELEPL